MKLSNVVCPIIRPIIVEFRSEYDKMDSDEDESKAERM